MLWPDVPRGRQGARRREEEPGPIAIAEADIGASSLSGGLIARLARVDPGKLPSSMLHVSAGAYEGGGHPSSMRSDRILFVRVELGWPCKELVSEHPLHKDSPLIVLVND